jgi:glycine oxidase
MSHWSILGSGVTALCVATALHAHGESIEIIGSNTHAMASHFAGGMLAPFCEAEAAPHFKALYDFDAIAWWQRYSTQIVQNGTLVLAAKRDHHELQRFATRTFQHQWVKPHSLEPELEHIQQALFFKDEAHLDPRLVLAELSNNLIQQGVALHSGKPSGKLIDCRGIYARDQISLRAVRGEMLILEQPELHFSRPIRLLHPRFPCYLVPRSHGRFMLGASMLESDSRQPITARSMMELLSAAYSIHPAFAEASIVETGVGLRPAYSDNIPKIHYQQHTFYINGMHRHGFLCAPWLAEQLIHQLAGSAV